MSIDGDALVFDTGPMRHFALNGWLKVLKFLAADRMVIIPESVEDEIKRQSHENPQLLQVLDAEWVLVDRSTDLEFHRVFASYEDRVAVGEKNRGECGVLALGELRGYEIVLDDAVPREIAEEHGIRVTATLPLLCQAIREGQLTVPLVEQIADDLLSSRYFLPFRPGEFRRWAIENGLIDYQPS